MATECCKIPKLPSEEYNKKYTQAIRMFPGNIDIAEKTIQNWRTEIPALFSFYTEDKNTNTTETSNMAEFLYNQQDLTQFLRFFLYTFQFPGGHLKAKEVKDIIQHGIRFKPAKLIINVLMAGNEIMSQNSDNENMSISAEEATYCIFNDLRVTQGKTTYIQIAKTIIDNRKNKIRYYNPEDSQSKSLKGTARTKGDMCRYAADILDYMEIANLVVNRFGYYSLKGNENVAIKKFATDDTFFDMYDSLYDKKSITLNEINDIEYQWFKYVNQSLTPQLFKTDLNQLIKTNEEIDIIFQDRIDELIENGGDGATKSIGNVGEAIICGHEKMRLKINGYNKFIKLVQIVDSPAYHPGFDIDSYEADGTEDHRYIEVKTTISKKTIQMYGFHMSPNEWRVANTIKNHYCIYRLMISENEKTLYILRNPIHLYKTDKIEAFPHDGMDISFNKDFFKPTKVLTWKS